MTHTDLKTTPLCAACEAAGGKMVDFHGWLLPVQFKGILAEHKAVREAATAGDKTKASDAATKALTGQ